MQPSGASCVHAREWFLSGPGVRLARRVFTALGGPFCWSLGIQAHKSETSLNFALKAYIRPIKSVKGISP
jgi:hypothetical protein